MSSDKNDLHSKWFSPGDIRRENIKKIQDSLDLVKVDLPEDLPQCAIRFHLNDAVYPDAPPMQDLIKKAEHNRLARLYRIGPNMDYLIKARLMVVHFHNQVGGDPVSLEQVKCFRFNYVGTSWTATLVIEGIDELSYVVGYDSREKKSYVTQHTDTGHWQMDDSHFFHIYGERD